MFYLIFSCLWQSILSFVHLFIHLFAHIHSHSHLITLYLFKWFIISLLLFVFYEFILCGCCSFLVCFICLLSWFSLVIHALHTYTQTMIYRNRPLGVNKIRHFPKFEHSFTDTHPVNVNNINMKTLFKQFSDGVGIWIYLFCHISTVCVHANLCVILLLLLFVAVACSYCFLFLHDTRFYINIYILHSTHLYSHYLFESFFFFRFILYIVYVYILHFCVCNFHTHRTIKTPKNTITKLLHIIIK